MTGALAKLRADVAREDVVRAIEEYDRLGRSDSSLNMVSAPGGVTSWSGTNAVTRTRRSWVPRTSSRQAIASARVTSRAGRAAPSRCSETWGSPSRKNDDDYGERVRAA